MRFWVLGLGVFLFACGDKTPTNPADKPDSGVDPDGGGNVEQRLMVETRVIDGLGTEAPTVGDNAQLALTSDGRASIAYGAVPQISTKYEIWYAERAADGTWTKEQVVIPGRAVMNATGQIIGLGLAQVGGRAHVVYLGGDDDDVVLTPYPTDLALSTRAANGTWSEEIIVDRSNEAPCDCPGTQDTCNFGNMVGTYGAIAATPDGNGYTIVYRDQHGGFARDDLIAKADVEIISTAASAPARCVDPVRSGGEHGNVTHTMSGRPVVAYNLISQDSGESRVGVWVAAYDGTAWRLSRVSDTKASAKIALATQQSGRIWLAFSHADDIKLVASYSDDDGLTWSQPADVDDDGKTGLHPSMAIDAMDRPVIVYGYCGRRSDSECPQRLIGRSQVKMARYENGAWQIYFVDDGQGFGHVGLFNSVVVFPDGKLGISYVDDMHGDLIFAKEL